MLWIYLTCHDCYFHLVSIIAAALDLRRYRRAMQKRKLTAPGTFIRVLLAAQTSGRRW
jgi:hypothetical protein